MSLPHRTVPILVWVDIDIDIVDLVIYLNKIPNLRTLTSCQGGKTYGPYVSCTWNNDEVLKILLKEFDVTLCGNYWGSVHPRNLNYV